MDGAAATEALKDALAGADGIACAFVFGSLAEGTARPDSDVDFFVVGSIEGRKLSSHVGNLSDVSLGRVLNYVLYTEAEFRARIEGRNHFVLSVLDRPMLFVVGSEANIARLRA